MLRYPRPVVAAAFAAGLCVASLSRADAPTVASPLVRLDGAGAAPQLAGSVAMLGSNPAQWKILEGQEEVRMVGLPLGPARSVTVLLTRIDPFAPDAVIVEVTRDAKGQLVERPLARPRADFFAGIVEGNPDSRVMIARTEAGVSGFVQDAAGTAIISSGPAGAGLPTVSYMLAELPEGAINWNNWLCGDAPPRDDGGPLAAEPEGGVAGGPPCRQLRVAVETDAEFTALLGSTTQSAAYAATIFAGVLDIYTRDLDMRPQMSYLRLWATPDDPWTAGSSGDQLGEFRNYWQANMSGVPRHVAHFLSARGLGGGVAWLSALCGSYAYAVSGNLNGYFPYPLVDNNGQNWDVMVVAHELGHNCGAPHTHNYCPPADECAPSGYFGSCQTQQTCTNQGTIMSYCHLCSGGMTNMQLKLHPKNIESMLSYFDGTNCGLTGTSALPAGNPDSFTALESVATDLDVLANDLGLNCESVVISSISTASSAGGSLSIIPGAGPGGRDVVRYQSPTGFSGAPDTFWYKLTDASSQTSGTISVTVDVIHLRAPSYPVGDVAGLDAKYYVLSSPSVLPRFELLSPYLTTTVANINYASTNGNFANSGRSDNVGALWTGWVRVDQPGLYTFYTTSDDGSALDIGSANIVNNDGLHGMTLKTGVVGLLPGKHPIAVKFFEAGGGAGCIVEMSGPGLARAVIPASRFTRGGTLNPLDLNGDGHVNGGDLGMLLSVFGTSNAAADFNNSGTVDGADLGILLAGWTG